VLRTKKFVFMPVLVSYHIISAKHVQFIRRIASGWW